MHLPRAGHCLGILALAGCAHYPANPPLAHYDPAAGYRYSSLAYHQSPEDLRIVLAFSGGGMRAAALSYGVLEELERTTVVLGGRRVRLLDAVGHISAVSGGSFTAAYYALYQDGIFRDYEAKFLKQNIERRLFWQLSSPLNWLRLASSTYGRSDLAADFYDRAIFGGKTFGDLARAGKGPYLTLNATDMSTGALFEFTQDQFDLIYSDLSTMPVARAVAASSAFPVLLSPVTVNNYGSRDRQVEPDWVEPTLEKGSEWSRRLEKAKEIRAYEDGARHPYLHLLDGGMADNLGLRSTLESSFAEGGARATIKHFNLGRLHKVAFIIVNAVTEGDRGWDQTARPPNIVQVVWALGSGPLDRYSYETMQLFRATLKEWEDELNGGIGPADPNRVQFYPIEVSLDSLADPAERAYFDRLPTALHLPPGAEERLRQVAGQLLRRSETYRALMLELHGERGPDAP